MKNTLKDRLRNTTKKQRVMALGLIAAAVLGTGGTVYYQKIQAEQAIVAQNAKEQAAKEKAKKQEEANKKQAKKELVEKAERAVQYLEDHQEKGNIAPAQEAVDKVEESEVKAEFQKRIDAVKAAIEVKEARAKDLAEAERLVKVLEDKQVSENVQPAQDAVNKVFDAAQKEKLQHRIDLVKAAIAQREAQATAQAQQSQASPGQTTPAETGGQGGSYYQAPAEQPSGGYTGGQGSYTPPAPNYPAANQPEDPAQRQQNVNQGEDDANNRTYNY
ncbi:hypothetical protein ACVR1I_03005 [Streptococcus cameli]